jgi:hypothetical protein
MVAALLNAQVVPCFATVPLPPPGVICCRSRVSKALEIGAPIVDLSPVPPVPLFRPIAGRRQCPYLRL